MRCKVVKEYQHKNVLEALYDRLEYIFSEFDNILVSFSGGKDSGLLLNLVLDYRDTYCPSKSVGVFHQDFEAQYSATTEYVERTFEKLAGRAERFWVCLPMATRTALSNYEMYWYPWDDTKTELWVRPMPKKPYVVNLESGAFEGYRYKMHQEDLAKQFIRWYGSKRGGKTVCLLGIRADESLQRYSGIVNKRHGYDGKCYITSAFKNVYTASPIYDWTVSDVWHAISVFGYDYNRLYDLYYMAGCSPDRMRVASPFNDHAKESLNYYRVIDPEIWKRLVCRVKGVNFGAIYGRTKAMGHGTVTLPEGYTWEEYTKFLLGTLPKRIKNNYIKKFVTSMDFWHNVGGGLSDEVIEELQKNGYRIMLNGVSNYTVMKHHRVVFIGPIPDDTDNIKSTKDIPSWKRMCICILKNDHNCRYMGFGLTREQQNNVNLLRKKYGKVGDGGEL